MFWSNWNGGEFYAEIAGLHIGRVTCFDHSAVFFGSRYRRGFRIEFEGFRVKFRREII
jgi:hypothetical protein